MKPIRLLVCFLLSLIHVAATLQPENTESGESIVFTTVDRSHYHFDVFTLPLHGPPSAAKEFRATDGISVNYNGHFPSPSPALLSLLPNETLNQPHDQQPLHLIYVTERNGMSSIYYDVVYSGGGSEEDSKRWPVRVQVPLISSSGKAVNSMKDKPSLSGEYLVYLSTHQDPGKPRASWTAVYSTELKTGLTRRLTPLGIADFSPAVSPSGVWTAVASYEERGWPGEEEELSTDIYVFLTCNGSNRVKVAEHGAWPNWVDDSTLYFHRRSAEDNWVSVYRAILPKPGPISTESVKIERVTPPGLHAFTPATSPGNHDFIAVATRRPGSNYRHVELFDLKKKEFNELTRLVSPTSHHFNPFISPDSTLVGYHRCRGEVNGSKSPQLFLEHIETLNPNLSLFRFDGFILTFSPTGDRVAYIKMPDLDVYVAKPNGSNRRLVYPGNAFTIAWDPVRPGIVYTSAGPLSAPGSTEVDIIALDVDANGQSKIVKNLTTNGKNNAFPGPSPDGKKIVFRSSRTGYKNLYIMDAEKGESGGLYRLTEGPWTDTMCTWSPDGEWIAFSSDRKNPGSGSFELFLIHPNRTGLRKLVQSGSDGKANHPAFSPDGKTIAFTTDYAGISAEPISDPNQIQPYGEIFTVKLDGSDIRRLTHNSYADGFPIWAPRFIKPDDVAWPPSGPTCAFNDCLWLNNTGTLKQ